MRVFSSFLFLLVSLFAFGIDVPVSDAIMEDENFIWRVVSVEFRDDCTIVKKEATPKTNGTWLCSSRTEFIESSKTKEKFYILWSSIGFEKEKVRLYNKETFSFTEIYPSVKHFDMINIHSGVYYYIQNLETNPYCTYNPYVVRPYNGSFCKTRITSVVITDSYTFVGLDYYSYYDEGWVSFDSNTTISDDSEFYAKILGLYVCDESGLIVEEKDLNQRYTVEKGVCNRIVLLFPKVPSGIHSLNIVEHVEPDGFFWYGIKINNVN